MPDWRILCLCIDIHVIHFYLLHFREKLQEKERQITSLMSRLQNDEQDVENDSDISLMQVKTEKDQLRMLMLYLFVLFFYLHVSLPCSCTTTLVMVWTDDVLMSFFLLCSNKYLFWTIYIIYLGEKSLR